MAVARIELDSPHKRTDELNEHDGIVVEPEDSAMQTCWVLRLVFGQLVFWFAPNRNWLLLPIEGFEEVVGGDEAVWIPMLWV